MIAIEIKLADGAVKVRRFGTGELKRWFTVRPGDQDPLTGWSYDELCRLGEGVWDFGHVMQHAH